MPDQIPDWLFAVLFPALCAVAYYKTYVSPTTKDKDNDIQ